MWILDYLDHEETHRSKKEEMRSIIGPLSFAFAKIAWCFMREKQLAQLVEHSGDTGV